MSCVEDVKIKNMFIKIIDSYLLKNINNEHEEKHYKYRIEEGIIENNELSHVTSKLNITDLQLILWIEYILINERFSLFREEKLLESEFCPISECYTKFPNTEKMLEYNDVQCWIEFLSQDADWYVNIELIT
jgi:hypothetical protein